MDFNNVKLNYSLQLLYSMKAVVCLLYILRRVFAPFSDHRKANTLLLTKVNVTVVCLKIQVRGCLSAKKKTDEKSKKTLEG